MHHLVSSHFQSKPEWTSLITEGDVMLMDRGYRDAREFISGIGGRPLMPSFLPSSQKQLGWEDANKSRTVTRVRFVVERVNKLWREWKFFSNVVHNKSYHHINDYSKIVCALLNMTGRSTWIESDHHVAVPRLIKDKQHVYNHLKPQLDDLGLSTRSNFEKVEGITSFSDFPSMDLIDIENDIALGSFGMEKAKTYITRHIRECSSGDAFPTFHLFEFKNNTNDVHYIKAVVHSRMKSAQYHKLWIQYDPKGNGTTAIDGWYCDCKGGERTASSCVHVTSIIAFLGYYRHHQDEIPIHHQYEGIFLDARGGLSLNTTSTGEASQEREEEEMEIN